MHLQAVPDLAPDYEQLSLAPLWDNLVLVCIGAAAIFAIVAVMYFLLRGKKQY